MSKPDDEVRRFLDAGVEARLNIGGVLGIVAFFGIAAALTAILGSNRDLRVAVPFIPPAVVFLYVITFGRLLGSANREGVRRRLGGVQRWDTLQSMSSQMQAVQSRNQQGRVHTERFVTTTWVFGSGSFSFSDRFLSNGEQLSTFASIAAAHAQPAKFGAGLNSEDARAALAAYAALPASKKGIQRPMLAGARPWLLAIPALAFTLLMAGKARAYWKESNEDSYYAKTPEEKQERIADLREHAMRSATNAAMSGLIVVGAIGGGVLGQRSYRRRRAEAGQ